MSRKPILIAAMMVLCAVMLVAAGCGGKKNAAATTAATTAASDTTAATTAASTDTMAQTTTASSGGGGSAADCQEFAKAAQDVGQQMSALTGNDAAAIAKAKTAFQTLADKAPADIKPDFETLADFFSKAADAFNGGNPDVSKLQALQGETAKVTTAAQNISTWAASNCH